MTAPATTQTCEGLTPGCPGEGDVVSSFPNTLSTFCSIICWRSVRVPNLMMVVILGAPTRLLGKGIIALEPLEALEEREN